MLQGSLTLDRLKTGADPTGPPTGYTETFPSIANNPAGDFINFDQEICREG